MSNEILEHLDIRGLTASDEIERVAELIYASDDYIYPYLFEGDTDIAKKVLCNMILADTVYNYANIRVALSSGHIIAALVIKPTPVKADYATMLDCFVRAGVPVGARFAKVYSDYFKLLEDEPPDIYVANLAVERMFRGFGVGGALLASELDDRYTYNLECVVKNERAWKLYQKLGFVIETEYPGFTEVPCYRMTRKARV